MLHDQLLPSKAVTSGQCNNFLRHSHATLHRNCATPKHRHDTVGLVNAVHNSKCLATSGELCVFQIVLFGSARTTYSACGTSAELHHGQLH